MADLDPNQMMRIQLAYTELLNEAVGSYLVDPGRYPTIYVAFTTAYESLKALWPASETVCKPSEAHYGCACWPRPLH